MKFFTTSNSNNIIATLRIVTIEKSELTFLLIYYISMDRETFATKDDSKQGMTIDISLTEYATWSGFYRSDTIFNEKPK